MQAAARLALFALALAGLLAISSGTAAAQATVGVSLREFSVTPSMTSVSAGAIDFQVSNDGGVPHNFRVVATDLAPDELPVDSSTGMVDESQVNVAASTSQDLSVGVSETVSANLAAGNYVLICNVPAHYGAGMRTAFTVSAAQQPTDTPAEPTETPVPGAPTSTPSDVDPTPTTEVTGLSVAGQGPGDPSSSNWIALVAVAAVGVGAASIGAAAYRRVRQRD